MTDTEPARRDRPAAHAARPPPQVRTPPRGPELPEALVRARRRKACRVAGDRARLRGRPVRAGRRRRHPDPERPPDLRAGRDGPRAVARAGRRLRATSSASSTSGSPSSPRCTSSRRAPRRRSPTSPTPSGARRPRRRGSSTGWSSAGSSSAAARTTTGACAPSGSRQRGQAVLRMVDRARAEQFLSAVRPLPRGERALIAMGVAALATHAISRRGRLVRGG